MAKQKNYDHLFKITLIGDYGSGKSSLMHRFVNSELPQFMIGIDFLIKTIELDLKRIKLQIWDTLCTHRFRTAPSYCYRNAKGIMLVYDITNRESFNNIWAWKKDVDERALGQDFVLMLVGNKCDLQDQRQVSIKEGKQMAEEFGIWFMETSAKSNSNVEQAFMSLVQDIKVKVEARPPDAERRNMSCIMS